MSGIAYHHTASGDVELVLTQGQERAYPWHMHARHRTLGLVRRGSALLATAATARRLYAGQHFYIRPYEPHSLSVAPESALLVLCFDAGSAYTAQKDALLSRHASFLQENEKAWIDETVAAYMENAFPHESVPWPRPACDSLLARSVLAIAARIAENPVEILHNDQMALHAGYSQWHFLRAFQKVLKMTPHTFQLLCRLRLLRSLLRADTASSAAVSAGFADQSHMHKVFKRHHGITPGEFKRYSFMLEL